MTNEQRQIRHLTKRLKELILACDLTLEGIDKVMSKRKDIPHDVGKNIALCANHLNLARDAAQHFGLGMDFKHPKFYYKPKPDSDIIQTRHT